VTNNITTCMTPPCAIISCQHLGFEGCRICLGSGLSLGLWGLPGLLSREAAFPSLLVLGIANSAP
jgi:hypothetical protein